MKRSEQIEGNTWDLSSLAKDAAAWEKDLARLKKAFRKARSFKGTLSRSPDSLYAFLCYLRDTEMEAERIGSWAFLSYEADSSNPDVQKRMMMYQDAADAFTQDISWYSTELISIDDALVRQWMKEPRYAEFRVYLKKSLREKKHILSEKEEHLLSLYAPVSGSAEKAFMDLNNIELSFDGVFGEKLTHGSYAKFLKSQDESVRETAYRNYYRAYDAHKNTIADLYISSVKEDIFTSKARNYRSSLDAALFPDNIPESVYRSLIDAVHGAFPLLHSYYETKAEVLGRKKLRHWDCYVPMVSGVKSSRTYDEAVALIAEAVKPLGEGYRDTLISGLTSERWVDRYENEGKRSGAFSAGGYIGKPYILTNYEDDVLDSVFTLIHEGGHSMHSWYSSRSNPFMCYSYSIFEAEVASTFNENLLSRYLLSTSQSDEEKAYILGKNLDDIVATLFRQTMFAEFELKAHEMAERGEPLTLEVLRTLYRSLLAQYFGPAMEFEDVSDLECLRIPHFYRAFYCFKYATGISASIALSERVLAGGGRERDDYMGFLKSGGSAYPIQALRKAGVDMGTPEPVMKATEHFGRLLSEVRKLRGI